MTNTKHWQAGRTRLKCSQAGEAAWARAGGLASVASVACWRWGDPAAAARAGFVTVALGVPPAGRVSPARSRQQPGPSHLARSGKKAGD